MLIVFVLLCIHTDDSICIRGNLFIFMRGGIQSGITCNNSKRIKVY